MEAVLEDVQTDHLGQAPAPPDFHVVVGHAPDFWLGNIAADVLVAGHAHGGQVQLAFVPA